MRFDSGRVCLDLVATGAGRPEGERLGSGEGLREWLYGAGLVPEGTAVEVGEGWLGPFTGLRALLERLVTAELAARGAPYALPEAADIAALNAAALAAPPAPAAVPGTDGALTRSLAAAPDCEGLLAAVARDAVDLFTDPLARTQLRRCAGENCTLVYLDTSRGRRRRWCSSEVCGNRERVARHRRRTTLGIQQG
jgi:predicted RNA-binding Zn ribbon-like protein